METKLHKVKGKNRFCGPAALSAVFGITTDHASRLIRATTGKNRVMGLYNTQLERTLTQAGVSFRFNEVDRLTVKQFSETCETGVYILNVTGHYVAYDATTQTICDNGHYKQGKKPLPLAEFKKKRVRVRAAFKILSGAIAPEKPKKTYDTPPASVKDLIDRYADDELQVEIETVEDRLRDMGMANRHGEAIDYLSNTADIKETIAGNSLYWLSVMREAVDLYELGNNQSAKTINMLAFKYGFVTKWARF